MTVTASENGGGGCIGRETVSTKVDGETRDWLESRAETADVSVAEYVRRVLSLYRQSQRGEVPCPRCRTALNFTPGVER